LEKKDLAEYSLDYGLQEVHLDPRENTLGHSKLNYLHPEEEAPNLYPCAPVNRACTAVCIAWFWLLTLTMTWVFFVHYALYYL
jgi:hypothetical protein